MKHQCAMESILRELAGYAGAKDPAALAAERSLLMEGAYVTRHVTGRHDAAGIGKRIVCRLLAAQLPAT
jgi:hypothetical protein